MKKTIMSLLVVLLVLLPGSSFPSRRASHSFNFNVRSIKGFPSGEVSLTGGGAYDPGTGFLKSGGSFSCLSDINQGPLTGCKAGEGVRWDASELLASTTFKCTGAATEALKTALTDDHTVVMMADFYRAGDGNQESFKAKMFVSGIDQGTDLEGTQTIWIQGVGCGDGLTAVH
jgi:hypothetical protein